MGIKNKSALVDQSMFSASRQDIEILQVHEEIMDLDPSMDVSKTLGSISNLNDLNIKNISTQGGSLITSIVKKLEDIMSDDPSLKNEISPLLERLEHVLEVTVDSYNDNTKGFH